MIPTKCLSIIASVILLGSSCSQNKTMPALGNRKNTDTLYSVSARDLKSNHIPDSVFEMTHLLNLQIIGMDCDYGDHTSCFMIEEIPPQIKKLTALTSLSLTVNAIQALPIEMAELKHLKMLDLTDNAGLSNIDNIEKLDSLEYLQLNGCRLTKLPANIGNLKYLKELALVGNNIDATEQVRIKTALPHCIIQF
jgi:Leucine-rich repeat (LRR) protein